MTDEEKQICLNELRALVEGFYGEDGSAVEQRKAARAYISSVQDLAGKIDALTKQVKQLEEKKADRAQENESDKDLGSLVKEVERLKNLIDGKRDASDASLIPKDVDTQINKLWEKLYALEKKYNEKSWRSTWDGFHPTLASFSPTVVSGSITAAEFGFGAMALKVRVWYFTYDFKSVTVNGAKVKLSGANFWTVLACSVLSCGLVGLIRACKSRAKVNAATTELMRVASAASNVCTNGVQLVN